MSNDATRRNFIRVTGGATALALAGCLGGGDDENGNESANGNASNGNESNGNESQNGTANGGDSATTFTVRIENTAPTDFYSSEAATGGAIWVTPGAYAVHTDSNPIFTQGEEASIGLEALAEAGPPTGFEGEDGLVDELPGMDSVVSAGAYGPSATVEDPNDPMGEVPGAPPIAPGGAFEFQVEAAPGERFSFASMYVPSNDVFISPGEEGIALYDDGTPVNGDLTDDVALWDAGTEVNESPVSGPNTAPRQSGAMAGATEGVVHPLDVIDDAFNYADASEVITVTLQPQ